MSMEHQPDLPRLGALVAARRKELGITQDELARRVGWSQERVSNIERGRYGLPSLPSLARLAAALDIPLTEILEAAGFATTPAITVESQTAPAILLYALEKILEVDGTDMGAVLDQVCTILGEALQADKIDVFLPEGATETLVAVGTSHTPMGRRQHELGLDRLPLSHGGSTVRAFQTGETFETGRAREDERVLTGIKRGLGVQSLIEIPFVVDGVVRGVLVISSDDPERFTPEDRRFAEAASRWVALIMHRGDLRQQVEQLAT
jgi:transcriptional regulator with XRE-family HTH domain